MNLRTRGRFVSINTVCSRKQSLPVVTALLILPGIILLLLKYCHVYTAIVDCRLQTEGPTTQGINVDVVTRRYDMTPLYAMLIFQRNEWYLC